MSRRVSRVSSLALPQIKHALGAFFFFSFVFVKACFPTNVSIAPFKLPKTFFKSVRVHLASNYRLDRDLVFLNFVKQVCFFSFGHTVLRGFRSSEGPNFTNTYNTKMRHTVVTCFYLL